MRAPRRRASLATRLSAWYACTAFLILLTATGFLYFVLVRSFDGENDQYLIEKAKTLQTLLRDHPKQVDTIEWEVEGESLVHPSMRVLSRVISEDRIFVETQGMTRELPRRVFPEPSSADTLTPPTKEIRTVDGRTFLLLSAKVNTGTGFANSGYVLQVALDLTFEKVLLASYRRQLWIVLGLGLFASILIGHRIARRGLRPLNEISAAIARTRLPNFGERVRKEGLPAELLDLAATFNELMDRLGDSFGRLSQFSSDIAHELRTPVNNLRGEIDVALSKARSPEEYQDLLGSLSEECDHLTRLIDSLLFLARAERPETQICREDLNMRHELELVTDFYDAAANEAGVTLELSVPDEFKFALDRTLFQRAIGNLIQNSLAHTPRYGHVQIIAKRSEGRLFVAVADDGVGISSDHLSRVFDRFYRVDPARAKDTGGLGLGLAIVQTIARLHGGSVEISSQVGKGTIVTLVFPDCPASQTSFDTQSEIVAS